VRGLHSKTKYDIEVKALLVSRFLLVAANMAIGETSRGVNARMVVTIPISRKLREASSSLTLSSCTRSVNIPVRPYIFRLFIFMMMLAVDPTLFSVVFIQAACNGPAILPSFIVPRTQSPIIPTGTRNETPS